MPDPFEARRILLIRRDNIGDLVCTTPLIAALRKSFPQAQFTALTNSYILPVLENNPDLDALLAYTKFKHRPPEQGFIDWLWNDRMKTVMAIRQGRFDLAVLAAPVFQPAAARFARLSRAPHVLGVTPDGIPGHGIDLVASVPATAMHEVERVFALGAGLGIDGVPPPLRMQPAPAAVEEARQHLRVTAADTLPLVAVHLSARGPTRQWPAANFVSLMRALNESRPSRFALFWSPGRADNPIYPGDDAKAAEVLKALPQFPIVALRTSGLSELIAGLAVCDALICVDGGVMHLAAALGRPMVCLFGDTDGARWHPWGVRHEIVQAASRDVIDVGVDEVAAAYRRVTQPEINSRA
jgi:ADP-heptose:LPS heptosyltransferase